MHILAYKCSIWGNTEIDWPGTSYQLDSKAVLRHEPLLAEGVLSKLPLERVLERYRPLRRMREPATLDGGDVMLAGKTLFVGVTARSNTAGIGQLAAEVEPLGYRVRPVVVRGCLHLKSACSYLGDAVLVHRPWVDEAAFAGVRLVDVPEER